MHRGFSALMNEKVTVQKPSGHTNGPYKATVSSDSITIWDDDVDVDEGDAILRELPNGKQERFTVTKVHFSKTIARGAIPSHYQLKVRKGEAPTPPMTGHTFNIGHAQGFQIGDHNTQAFVNAFEVLLKQIETSNGSPEQKAEAKGRIRALLEHPLVSAVIGGAARAILSSL